MEFNKHPNLEGKHAYLSPSNYHWINYDDEKFDRVFMNFMAKDRGTKLHALACSLIDLGVKLPDNNKTLNMYVNDCIGFGLRPEVILYYSEFCFGTADAIGYSPGLLRISDLKTGATKVSMSQLKIYAAIFFLEYGLAGANLNNTEIELRIYQSGNIIFENPDKREISDIMASIVSKDKRIQQLKRE